MIDNIVLIFFPYNGNHRIHARALHAAVTRRVLFSGQNSQVMFVGRAVTSSAIVLGSVFYVYDMLSEIKILI